MESIIIHQSPASSQHRWCCRVGAWQCRVASRRTFRRSTSRARRAGRPISQGASPGIETPPASSRALPRAPFFYLGGPPMGEKTPLAGRPGRCGFAGPRALASLSPWAMGLPPSGLVSTPSSGVLGLVRPSSLDSPRVRHSKHPHKGHQGQQGHQGHQGQEKDTDTGAFLSLASLLSLLSLVGFSSTQSPGR
jgi:hypothetical protein